MFKQYSYKTKFQFLLALFVMLSIASYKRSFSNLLSLYAENTNLKDKKELITAQRPNITNLTKEVENLDKIIGKEGVEKEKIQQEILNFLVENGSEVSIFDLQPIHDFDQDDYKIDTFQLDLIGSYNQLLRLAYSFEKEFEYSKIISLKFYTDKKNNKNTTLHLKLIFQNYENKK